MTAENALHCDPHLRPHVFALPPIDTGAVAHRLHEFGRDDTQFIVAHDFDSTLVLCQGIIKLRSASLRSSSVLISTQN